MRFLRQVLAILLVFSLAATPVAARVSTALKASHAGTMVKMASMPDCHGMQMVASNDKPSSQKHCPDCDSGKACSADQCQFKCFKVLAALPKPARAATSSDDRYGVVQYVVPALVSLTPQPPPPRA